MNDTEGGVSVKYRVLMVCNDCGYGQDPQGCFDGGSEYLYQGGKIALFDTRDEAEDAFERKCDGAPWDYTIEEITA